MKRALLLSDSHGQNEEMIAVLEHFSDVDAIFHMGDIGNAKLLISNNRNCLTYIVRGNTDYDYDLPEQVAIDFAGKRILATHGHRYVDYGGIDSLVYFGEENNADVVLFGHIHRPVYMKVDIASKRSMIICNPGSISRPRQRDREKTFAVLTVTDEGDVDIQYYSVYEENAGVYAIEVYAIEE